MKRPQHFQRYIHFLAQILETSIKGFTEQNLPSPEITPLLVWIEHKLLIKRNASTVFLQDFPLKNIESTLVTPVKYIIILIEL